MGFRGFALAGAFLLIFNSVVRADTEALKCPAPQPEYSALIKRLDDLKLSLEDKGECKDLRDELSDLSMFQSNATMTYESSIVDGIQKKVIDPDSLKKIGDYTRQSATKILNVVKLLDRSPGCVAEKQKPSFLSTLAMIAQQTTSLASSYAGPYGVAISVGGSIFSNLLLAFDDFFKAGGYDFNDPAKRHLFLTSICIYNDIRQEIMDTINPAERLSTMEELVGMLNEKEQLIRNYCSDCEIFFKTWDTARRSQPRVLMLRARLKEVEASRAPVWNDCVGLADSVHNPEGDLAKLIADLRSNLNTAAGVYPKAIEDILWTYDFAVREGIPTSRQCWAADEKSLKSTNERSRALVQNILDQTENFLNASLTKMILDHGNIDSNNLPYKLSKTFSARDWAEHERSVLRRLSQPGSSEARAEINQRRLFLTRRLLVELAPQFLSYEVGVAVEGNKAVTQRLKATRDQLNSLFSSYKSIKDVQDPDVLAANLMEISIERAETNEDAARKRKLPHQQIYALAYDYLSYVDRIDFALSTVSEYCIYFEKAGTKFPEIAAVCDGGSFKSAVAMNRGFENLKTSILRYVDWCHEEGYIQADSARLLQRNIQEFNRGLVEKYPDRSK